MYTNNIARNNKRVNKQSKRKEIRLTNDEINHPDNVKYMSTEELQYWTDRYNKFIPDDVNLCELELSL